MQFECDCICGTNMLLWLWPDRLVTWFGLDARSSYSLPICGSFFRHPCLVIALANNGFAVDFRIEKCLWSLNCAILSKATISVWPPARRDTGIAAHTRIHWAQIGYCSGIRMLSHWDFVVITKRSRAYLYQSCVCHTVTEAEYHPPWFTSIAVAEKCCVYNINTRWM